MRGSHHAPLMPVSLLAAHPARFDGPPRVVCLGYQLKDGQLHGPRDMFDDPSFEQARRQCNQVMDYLRPHGPLSCTACRWTRGSTPPCRRWPSDWPTGEAAEMSVPTAERQPMATPAAGKVE
jgi:hypothetical protein